MDTLNQILLKTLTALTNEECKKINTSLVSQFLLEFSRQDRSGIYGFTQRELTYNSNKMEGSRLTKEQTIALFNTGTVMSDGEIYRAKDIEEAQGHFLMFNYALSTLETMLSEDIIKEYHRNLKQGVFEDRANGYPIGEYKNRENVIWDIDTVRPDMVSNALNDLLCDYHSSDKSLTALTSFHAQYEKIHPFQDGNGRTGRMILFKECLVTNNIPFIVRDINKEKYTYSLNKAQKTGELMNLIEYFREEQEWYYTQVQKFLKRY